MAKPDYIACAWFLALDRTNLRVTPFSLGSSLEIGAGDIEHALERGIDLFCYKAP